MTIQNKERRLKLIQLRSQATVVSGERLRRYVEHKLRTELPEEYKERLQAVHDAGTDILKRRTSELRAEKNCTATMAMTGLYPTIALKLQSLGELE